jgi:F0F1-type ATP synthase membrane subunit b/b'
MSFSIIDKGDESPLLKNMPPKSMILVMGITGAGKSSFVNQLPLVTDKKAEVGHSMSSCSSAAPSQEKRLTRQGTTECETLIAEIGGAQVLAVDTPGFDDDSIGVTDAVILEKIAKILTAQIQCRELKIQLKGIIYLQRISDIRIGQSGMRALKILQEICGSSAMGNVVLTTTRWGDNPDNRDEERETFLQDKAWSLILSNGARMQRYHGTRDSALAIVRDVLRQADVVLDIQDEIVKQGKRLNETNAGALVSGNLEVLQDELKKSLAEIDRLRQELTKADRIRADRQYAEEAARLYQAQAAEELLKKRLRDELKAEVEAELEASKKETRNKKFKTAAKVVTTAATLAVSIVLMVFGFDPSFAANIGGWFG